MRRPIRSRPLLLRLHVLVGMFLAAGLLLLGLSGAILLFRSELERALEHPAVEPSAERAPLQALVAAARLRHPDATPTVLVLPEHEGRPARVQLRLPHDEDVDVLLDPATGAVLASRWHERSALHALRLLHTQLYLGPRGTVLVGLLGLGLLLQAATGLYLWWPFTRRPGRGVTIRWTRPWPVLTYDLHKSLGVLSLAFNVPLALTGALLAWSLLTGSHDPVQVPAAPPAARPSPITLDEVARAADAALPGGRIRALELSGAAGGLVTVRKRLPGDFDPRGAHLVTVALDSGAATAGHRRNGMAGELWALLGPLHSGEFAGLGSKLVYLVGGLTSSFLVLSGLLAWLTRPRVRRSAGPAPAGRPVAVPPVPPAAPAPPR